MYEIVFILNKERCKEKIEDLYQKKTQEILGFDLNNLTFNKQNVTVIDCSKCKQELRIKDNGLYEDNIAIFWYMCKKLYPKSNFCAGIIPENEKHKMKPYRFCYDETSVQAIEKAIELCDYIRACDVASYNTLEICEHRIRQKREVSEDFLYRLFEGQLKSKLHSRKTMWHIINEGLKRLLVMPKKLSKNEPHYEYQLTNIDGLNVRAFHGHQLSDLIKRDRYDVLPYKEDVLMFGHFHLQMVLYKYDTWVLITGHWTYYQNPRKVGFLSHIGSPIMLVNNKGEPVFVLNRFPDVKTELKNKLHANACTMMF